jgi:hypothetical protein
MIPSQWQKYRLHPYVRWQTDALTASTHYAFPEPEGHTMSHFAKAVDENAKFLDIGRLVRSVGAFALAALLVGAAGPVLAAKSTTHPRTDALFQASEIAENLSESSTSINVAAFDKAMSDIDALGPRLNKALSPDRKQALDTLVTAMRSAWTHADRSAVGVQAIDAFRLLQEAMPRGSKAIPVQVDQLDYVGFKVKALLSSSSVDWAQVSDTVREASTWWSSIEARTADVTLKDAMNRTILGMKAAADLNDPKLMNFAADMELILVDGLETFFTAHPRSH